ncbi:MAG: tetratricopeptide repeat protein [Rhodospirillaceae bacterium]|nr:MAG: tetratricopeptide repeat protein [Rhodospirillaceae bacterium]
MIYGRRNDLLAIFFCLAVVAVALALSTDHAFAFGASSSEDEHVDKFRDAEKAVKAKDYNRAVQLLQDVLAENPNNANALNYLAFSQRNLGQLDDAMKNYNAALTIKPDHKGALAYQGELYLMLGNQPAAQANLDKLSQICKRGCQEKDALVAALAHYNEGQFLSNAPATTPGTGY